MRTHRVRRFAVPGAAFAALLALGTGCSDGEDPADSGDPTPSARESVPSPTPSVESTPTEPPPPVGTSMKGFNEWERDLVRQLRDIGVDDAYPGEDSFRGANVSGHDSGGERVQVMTVERDRPRLGEEVVTGTVTIRGLEVRMVRWGSGPKAAKSLAFECGDLRYDVRKYADHSAHEFDRDAAEGLTDRLIAQIGC